MESLAATAQASDFHSQLHSPISTNCFGGTIDIDELLSLFSSNGLHINPEHGEAALQACANFEYSKCTQEEFLNIMKEYCVVHRNLPSIAHVAVGAVPVIGAGFGLILALVKVSNAIKDRAKAARERVKTAELKARYLRGLATADNLSIEATNIALVMTEIIARGFDDYETMNLSASSSATVQLLREDLLPYLKSLHNKDPSEVKVFELRNKRWELKQRLIRQYEIVNVHYTRVEQGLAEMKSGREMYYMKTNRLAAYARECLLEIHLRAWYAMLGYFDPENTMIEHDDRNVGIAASEKIAMIQGFFEEYANARLGLLTMKYESKKDLKSGMAKHEHTVYIADHGAESDNMVPRLSIKSLMEKTYVRCEEPEGGGIDHFPDGSCEIWNDTMWSNKDRCSATGRYVHDTVRQYVGDQLKVDGPVWTSTLGFVDRMRRAVQPALPIRPGVRGSITAPARVTTWHSTTNVSVPSRVPMVQGHDDWYYGYQASSGHVESHSTGGRNDD